MKSGPGVKVDVHEDKNLLQKASRDDYNNYIFLAGTAAPQLKVLDRERERGQLLEGGTVEGTIS